MMGLQLRINNELVILNVQVIRTGPKGDIETGDECTYLARIYNQDAGTIHHPYGDAPGLAKKMIDLYGQFSDERLEEFKMKDKIRRVKEAIDENERPKGYGGIVPGRIQPSVK